MRRARPRVLAIVAAAAMAVSTLAAAPVAAADPPVPGTIQINGGVFWTNQGTVTVSTPAANAASMRLSSDGIQWKTMGWASSTSWDMTDPAYGGTSAPGTKWVYVEFDDGTNTWDPAWWADSAHIYYDTQAPAESQMRASFELGRQVNGGLVTMRVTWFNDDHAQSGTATYNLETRMDAGSWTPIGTHPVLPGFFYAVSPGHTYQLRVQAVDNATNVSDWYEGPAFRVAAYQESNSKLSWKRAWTGATSSSYWGGHARTSAKVGATAKITFTGRMIALVTRLGPKRGSLAVYVNGVKVDSVALRAASNSYRRVAWTKWWATSATRTVTFKIQSVPGSDRAEVDAILTGN